MTEQQVRLKITGLSKSGKGVGETIEGSLCEVPFTLPGDIVKVQLDTSTQGIFQGKAASIEVPSPLRVSPRCSHFTKCGGCRLQHIPYKGQLLHKEKGVRNLFAPMLNSDICFHSIIPCKAHWNYRTKMDYTFSFNEPGKYHIGHVQEGTKGSVVNVNECYLCPQWFMDAVAATRQWWAALKAPAYDPVNNRGVLRQLTLREGRRSGDRMVILNIASRNDFELGIRHIEKFVMSIKEYAKPHLAENQLSIYLRVHQAGEGTTSSQYDMLLYGPGVIREEVKVDLDNGTGPVSLQFEVGPSSFFQPNPLQAEVLYARALQMAELTPATVVYDLYCGAGTIGLCASSYVKQVVGIELSPESAANARTNIKLNGCSNMSVYSGAVRHVLNQLQATGVPRPDVVIVNPPRAGLDPEALQHLQELNPPKILYLSCYPETQAKNVASLLKSGYCLTGVQPVDQFPQTNHVENIVLLQREARG